MSRSLKPNNKGSHHNRDYSHFGKSWGKFWERHPRNKGFIARKQNKAECLVDNTPDNWEGYQTWKRGEFLAAMGIDELELVPNFVPDVPEVNTRRFRGGITAKRYVNGVEVWAKNNKTICAYARAN